MLRYTSNSGKVFTNFDEVIDYFKTTKNAVLLKDCPNYRAFLLKDDGVYTLKIAFISPIDHTAYVSNSFEFGTRLTDKKKVDIENMMERFATFYSPDPRTFYTYMEKTFNGEDLLTESKNEWVSHVGLDEYHNTADAWRKLQADAEDFYGYSGAESAHSVMSTLTYHNQGLIIERSLTCRWDGDLEQ